MDIDFFIEPTPANAKRTLKALQKFGYDTKDLSVTDLLTKKILIRQYATESDFHPFVTGVSFRAVWKNRVKGKIGKTSTYFASLGDLIRMKKAVRRAKDVEDLRVLEKLRRRKKRADSVIPKTS